MISDYGDVPALQTTYHIAADFPGAIAKAVNAGVDVAHDAVRLRRLERPA